MGRYAWLVKLSFAGAGGGVSAFKAAIAGQCSPAALPLVDGRTTMTYTRDDLDCVLLAPDLTVGAEELRRFAVDDGKATWSDAIQGHYHFPGGNGGVVFRVETPDDVVRVQAGARFGCRDPRTLNGISFSLDEGKTWVVGCRQPLVGDEDHNEEHWCQCVDAVLDLPAGRAYSLGCTPAKGAVRGSSFTAKPTRSVLVKFHTEGGDGALVQVFGIYALHRRPGALPLTITHAWSGGQHVERIGADERAKTYVVEGGPRDANEWVRIEARSP
jgi:hypothetical protein